MAVDRARPGPAGTAGTRPGADTRPRETEPAPRSPPAAGRALVRRGDGVNASDGTVTTLRTLNQTGTLFTRPGYDDVIGVGSPTAQGLLRFIARRGGHGSGHPTH